MLPPCFDVISHIETTALERSPSVAYCVSPKLFRAMTTGVVDVKDMSVREVTMLSAVASAVSICASDHASSTSTNSTENVSFEIANAWLAYDASTLNALLEKQDEEKMIVPFSPETLLRAITCLPMARGPSQTKHSHVPTFRLRITHVSSLDTFGYRQIKQQNIEFWRVLL